MKQRAELEILSVFVNFSGQNFVKVADGSGILEEFGKNYKANYFECTINRMKKSEKKSR